MNNSRNVTQKSQKDVEEEGAPASRFKEHTQWREDDRGNEFDDIATGKSHFWKFQGVEVVRRRCVPATFMYWRLLLGFAAKVIMSMHSAYNHHTSGSQSGCAQVQAIFSLECCSYAVSRKRDTLIIALGQVWHG